MNLTFTETQAMLEASALHWLAGNAQRVRDADDPGAFWPDLGEMGWLALPFDEADGGFGGGPIEAGLLMRAFGRHGVAAPAYRSGVLLAGRLVALLGSGVQREQWLEPLMASRRRLAMAYTEAGQDDPWAAPGTTATWHAGSGTWTLQGAKSLVVGGPGADALLVSAAVHGERGAGSPSRPGLFLLPGDTPGVRARACALADGSHAAELVLQDVSLPADARLGDPAARRDVGETYRAVVAQALIASCWEAVGAMRAALEATVAHVTQREQFGRPLSTFQVVQHRLAEMAVCCEEATAACELAALRATGDWRAACDAASLARSCTARAARYVAAQAVQLHGGMGVSEELPVAGLFRLLTRFQLQDGSADWHAARLGEGMPHHQWRESQTLLAPSRHDDAPRREHQGERAWICN